MTPYLSEMFIYPIKSLDGAKIESSCITQNGALVHDRRLAMFDKQDQYVNGKRNEKVHGLRTTFDDAFTRVHLQIEGTNQCFDYKFADNKDAIEDWLSEYFEQSVEIKDNQSGGYPDDTESPGPTIISKATIREISSWFSELDAQLMRRRFRPNLVIDGVPAFWEDCLYGEAGTAIEFTIGNVQFQGINPCQRCIVPWRDPITGEKTGNFSRTFVSNRKETLPSWTNRSQFDHFYRIAVNTLYPVSTSWTV